MTREDDFDRGVRNRRAMLGDDWVDRSLGNTTAFNADFQDHVTRHAWHDVWGRPGLDEHTRRLLVLGMTMGLARWEEFELHCRAAVRGGVPVEKIRETLMQGAIYCGVPAANTAFKLTTQILRDEGKLPPPAPLTPGRRVQTHHTFSTPQLRIALQGVAAGAPVVLSHALGADLHLWDEVAARLAPSREVLRYDHRGHGGSQVVDGPYTMDELVDDAARVIREWGVGPVVFCGVSLGGMVAQGLAIRHPELLRGVVIAHTNARYLDETRAMWASRIAQVSAEGIGVRADGAMERWFTPAFRDAQPERVEQIRQTMLRTDRRGYVGCAHAIAAVDWLAQLPAVRCPALVVASSQDPSTPLSMCEEIAQAIPGAELRVLPAAHISPVELPDAFVGAIGTLLARCGG